MALVLVMLGVVGVEPRVGHVDDLSPYSRNSSTLDPYDPDWPLADEFAAFTRPLPRTTVDRPDEVTGTKVKVLYVVPSFSTDRGRDRSGEIAQTMFMANQYLASQNGGFGVRFDTYQGALDIGYMTIDTTLDEWYDLFVPDPVWHVSLSGMQDIVRAHGWDIAIESPVSNPADFNSNDLYFLVYEAPAGAYFKTGAGAGSCRPGADALNRGMRLTGAFVQQGDGTPCSFWAGRFPEDGTNAEQRDWILTWRTDANTVVDQLVQAMRWLPNCGHPVSPRDGELYTVPGTDIVEIRGGFIRDLLELNDPIASRMGDSPPDSRPQLDVRHDTYFHITSGTLAGTDACNGDISHSSLWEDLPLDRDRPHLPRRTVYDRPDDQSGAQLHAVYAVAKAAPDRQRDTDGTIESGLRQLDRFLRAETGEGVRLDTYQGHADVTYLPLPWTAAEFAAGKACSGPPCPYEADLLAVLDAAGLSEPNKQYVFFYEGDIVYAGHSGLCGGSMPGRASLINLADFTATGGCGEPVWSNEDPRQWSVGLLAGHEMLHALGGRAEPDSRAPDARTDAGHR